MMRCLRRLLIFGILLSGLPWFCSAAEPLFISFAEEPVWLSSSTALKVNFLSSLPCRGLVEYTLQNPVEYQNPDFQYSLSGFWGRNQSVVIRDLTPDTTIFFKVYIYNGAATASTPETFFTARTLNDVSDVTAPVLIQLPRQAAVSGNEVYLEFLANEPCSASIYAGKNPDHLNRHWIFQNEGSPYFMVRLHSGLDLGHFYYASVQLWDDAGNYSERTGSVSFIQTMNSADTKSPELTDSIVYRWIDTHAVEIEFHCDELCTCLYQYGTNGDCIEFGPIGTKRASESHTIVLNDIPNNGSCRFRYQMTDMFGNANSWSDCLQPSDFNPLPGDALNPRVLRGPDVRWIGDDTAFVTCSTDYRCDVSAPYWAEERSDITRESSHYFSGCDGKLYDHELILPLYNWTRDYIYQLRIGTQLVPDLYSFVRSAESDVFPPVLTYGPVVFSYEASAGVYWETDECSDSQILLGCDTPAIQFKSNPSLVREHFLVLSGLAPDWGSNAKLISRDPGGNAFFSEPFAITTVPDSTAPSFVTYPAFFCNADGYVDLFFQTSEPCTYTIETGIAEPLALAVVESKPALNHKSTLQYENMNSQLIVRTTIRDLSGFSMMDQFQAEPPPACTPTPPPDPDCTNLGVKFWMTDHYFRKDDVCQGIAFLCNPYSAPIPDVDLFVLLEFYGEFYFAPSWTATVDSFHVPQLKPGKYKMEVLPEFSWPEIPGQSDDIFFWSVMMDSVLYQVMGEIDLYQMRYGQ